MSAQAFAEAYQAAIYKAAGVAFTLTENPTGVVLFEGRKFAIITAHNPKSERLSPEENQQRHQELERILIQLGLEHGPSTGESPDGSWVEEGFVVFDIGFGTALELGRKFGQHAILWGEGGKVALLWSEPGKVQWVYPKMHRASKFKAKHIYAGEESGKLIVSFSGNDNELDDIEADADEFLEYLTLQKSLEPDEEDSSSVGEVYMEYADPCFSTYNGIKNCLLYSSRVLIVLSKPATYALKLDNPVVLQFDLTHQQLNELRVGLTRMFEGTEVFVDKTM